LAGGAVKAAVYNRHWASFGGGERHAGRIAAVLAADGAEVDVVGPEPVDLALLGERLALNLSGVRMRVVPDDGDWMLAEVSREYDLFVNGSYMSRLVPHARRNIYLCYFPTPADHDLSSLRRWLIRRLGPIFAQSRRSFDHGLGWFPREGGHRRSWTWTNGDATIILGAGTQPVVEFDLARVGGREEVELRIEDAAGRQWAQLRAGAKFTRHRIQVGDSAGGTAVRFRSGTFVPGDGDNRTLGVAVSRLRVGAGRSLTGWVTFHFPWLLRDPGNVDFVTAYDRILANSEFTRSWIERLWGVDAAVLFPPIRLDPLPPAAERARVIASVGRFFAPGFGHSKRQLEMVKAFGALHRSGALPGWRMRVLGGCEKTQEPYLTQVRSAAVGLPVEIVPNASRADVEALLSSAAIFWSATGLGQHEERRPWTLEHFGITTVEAMSGGCVPVVIDKAGHKEIVRDGVDGFRWADLAGLRSATLALAGDPDLLRRMSAAARLRAAEFSEEAFDARFRAIAAQLGIEPERG
jgi:glycosyltransferase involved in cell wall biosynthesis